VIGPRIRASLTVVVVVAGCTAAPSDIGSSSAAVTVCGMTTVTGIDVYHGDNGGAAIDWNAVKSGGMSFAFAKASQSTNFTDPMFATNWSGMKSAGLVRGAYHYFDASVDPTSQATYFLGVVGTVTPGDMLALDLETTNGETQATVLANAITFLSAVQSMSGVTPMLYVSPLFLSSYTGLGGFPLWVANYGVTCPDVPSPWTTYTFWQSGTGTISAISGAVDLDSFNGTLAELQALGKPPMDAGQPTDASTEADAFDGSVVGSEPPEDGGNMESTDSGNPDSGEPSGTPEGSSGCSCTLDRPERSSSFGVFALLGFLAIAARRRQKR